ncbi:hypothetical protein GCM10008107_10210 [Psychrosphaera saromensis]|uniref:Uncharacterized protein n=1 Tax=Psychrosphaera saromensis TaxID=716813 RepID=A0A2S7UVB1_9GAMM|nr:hypothetical protein [Psychrosphaera saromensis]PQJ53699.1 hypothetical protein BTO11_08485 [Psychrosphaera saromensis]GHB63070.1 hypothetical protein GCM10008107_10210 [Psychrosphaera saromensis]GLQ15524.1 hypothetical protein GCM10007917_29790 [Psychrosphaera saromensis]
MTSIHDLAKCILLDDVNDVFYRSLCFSNYARTEYDAKSDIEKKLDTALEQRLARQLNWSSSICSLDAATHKFSHLLELIMKNQLTESGLVAMLDDNYWLKSAVEIELGQDVFTSAIEQSTLVTHLDSQYINKRLAHIAWRYFASQMSDQNQYLLQQVVELSDSFAEKTMENASERNESLDEDMAYHLTFINSYSFVVLLKLFDRAVQSVKHDALNTTAFECEQQRLLINQYQPMAISLLSFMVFDEFLKPNVLDNLNLSSSTSSNLINGDKALDSKSQIFVMSRGQVIVERLNKSSVLTAKQLADFTAQMGIKFEVKQNDLDLDKSGKLWAKLLSSIPTLASASAA